MNEENFILYEWNAKTKEFWFLGEKIDYIHNPQEWRKYLNNLVTENKELKQENQQLKSVIDELEKWLKEKLEECNTYSKYIEKKVTELQARSSGKTYIASEIMKNEVTKKNWKEILNKINELKDSDIK